MAKFYLKVTLFGLLLLFCILFGVSLATSGIERIQGPLASDAVHKTIDKQPIKAMSMASPPPPKVNAVEPILTEDRSLNLVGNKLGDLLQIVAHHGIKWFVSLFDAVLGKG
jgi:hypothetical protein